MHMNIAQKIFGIAAVVLALMLVVAIYSIRLTAGISDDLAVIAGKQLPVTAVVTRINVRILEQGGVLQRLFVKAEDHDNLTTDGSRFDILGDEIEREFIHAHRLLEAEERTAQTTRRMLRELETSLSAIEAEYLAFQAHGRLLVEARAGGDHARFADLLPALNGRQDALDAEIAALRRHVERLTDDAVLRADREERNLLIVNSALTLLAALLALSFASAVTRALVRSVRDLVTGAEAIEAGNLDTEVPITTHDEVGRLTGSFNSMVGGLRLKERIKDTFGKYMDPRIVSNLLDHPEYAEPGGERREMTVMFIDLKGFTSISEKLPPGDLVRMINDFYTHMTRAISDNKGVVDKFIGDAVMAYWGPPFIGSDEHAVCACKAALEALDRLQIFREDVRRELGAEADGLDIDLRIGVSSGEMIVGTLGSEVSRNFTVLGDPVNLGSRLEGANKAYGTRILISERTCELVGDAITAREIDLIRVKGKDKPTRIFELLDNGRKRAELDGFSNALAAYRKGEWDIAETTFQACLSERADDPPSNAYLKRIAHLRDSPPPPDWDGVWVFDTK
jgi:class 3 adenylate cyclase